MKRWTDEEIEILKNNYKNKPKNSLLILLQNRTWPAILEKARKFKLCFGRYGLTSEERFWSYVDKKSNNECWNWVGHCNKFGYGTIQINNQSILTHRFCYELFFDKISENKPCVLHKCDNPSCVNPNHLFLGTHQDNYDDMVKKGRDNKAKGDNHGMHKLTINQVKKIKKLKNKFTHRKIATMFNIDPSVIGDIYNNKLWLHVK